MLAAGIDDLLIPYNVVGSAKAERRARVARRANLRVAVDDRVALETVAAAADPAQREIGVLIEFESMKRRQGVHEPADALALGRHVQDSAFLRFRGLMTYPSSPESAASRLAHGSPPWATDRLRIVPNHVCPVSNLLDEVHVHSDGVLEAVVSVAARGKVR